MDDLRSALFSFFNKEPSAVIAVEEGKVIYNNAAAARLMPDILGADARELFGPELAAPGAETEGVVNGKAARGMDLGSLRLITLAPDSLPLWEERSLVDTVASKIHESLGPGLYRLSCLMARARDAGDLSSIRDLASVDKNICQVLRIVRNLGRLYGNEDSHLRKTLLDLAEVVRDIVSSVAYLSKNREVLLELDSMEAVEIYADRRVLEIMLMELLSNAVKYSCAGGIVTVSVGVSGSSAVIKIVDRGNGEGKERLLTMENRFGISAAALDPDAGAGLGLRAARHMAALHGGALITQTLPDGAGTVVTVALPLPSPEDGLRLSDYSETGCTVFDILIEISDIADDAMYESRDAL